MTHTLRTYWPIAVVFTACILVFILDRILEAQGSYYMLRFVLVPAEINMTWQSLMADGFNSSQLATFSTLLSYAFLHGNAEHILMNLVFIWVFGSLVFRELGTLWFFIVFVVTAIAGGDRTCLGRPLLDGHPEAEACGVVRKRRSEVRERRSLNLPDGGPSFSVHVSSQSADRWLA